jgi:hypothetical protein
MFVMATVYSNAGSAPVKLRDLSPTGALIEGGAIPAAGTSVTLCRGSLRVAGEVVWCARGRAGLKLCSEVTVSEWLPNGRSLAPQQRVDEAVQRLKAASSKSSLATEPKPAVVSALELARAKRMIESLAEALAGDLEVLGRHGEELQALDIAAQLFGKLATHIR